MTTGGAMHAIGQGGVGPEKGDADRPQHEARMLSDWVWALALLARKHENFYVSVRHIYTYIYIHIHIHLHIYIYTYYVYISGTRAFNLPGLAEQSLGVVLFLEP